MPSFDNKRWEHLLLEYSNMPWWRRFLLRSISPVDLDFFLEHLFAETLDRAPIDRVPRIVLANAFYNLRNIGRLQLGLISNLFPNLYVLLNDCMQVNGLWDFFNKLEFDANFFPDIKNLINFLKNSDIAEDEKERIFTFFVDSHDPVNYNIAAFYLQFSTTDYNPKLNIPMDIADNEEVVEIVISYLQLVSKNCSKVKIFEWDYCIKGYDLLNRILILIKEYGLNIDTLSLYYNAQNPLNTQGIDDALEELSSKMQNTGAIKAIIFEPCNGLEPLNLKILQEFLSNFTNLNNISLHFNPNAFRILQSCKPLTTISLHGNLGDINSLLQALYQHQITLEALEIYNPHNTNEDFLGDLAKFLSGCINLKKFSLTYISSVLSIEIAQVIADALKHCKNLTAVGMHVNYEHIEAMLCLAQTLVHCKNIKNLDISRRDWGANGVNEIDFNSSKKLAQVLVKYLNLVVFILNGYTISKDSLEYIMSLCKSLVRLHVKGAFVGDIEVQELLNAVKTMPMLDDFACNNYKPTKELKAALDYNKSMRKQALTFVLSEKRCSNLPLEIIDHMFHNFFYQPPGTHSDAGNTSYFNKR